MPKSQEIHLKEHPIVTYRPSGSGQATIEDFEVRLQENIYLYFCNSLVLMCVDDLPLIESRNELIEVRVS